MDIMLPAFIEFALFIAKAAVIVIALLVILSFAMKMKEQPKLTVRDLNKRFKSYRNILLGSLLNKKNLKKEIKKATKEGKKAAELPRAFVLDFKGDIRAHAVENLREAITAILSVANTDDEVILKLESPGGVVHGYGLAASQLKRIKDAGLTLTICVDKIAASGGYMMACLGDKIIAAPFAIIGSVGVVASVPNFNKILRKNDVDYYQITAGQYKRTLTLLGEVTDEGLKKFKAEIEDTHVLFKDHIKTFRPRVDVDRIGTGEHWFGQQALDLALVDALGTSDDYLFTLTKSKAVKEVHYQDKRGLKEKMADGFVLIVENLYELAVKKLHRRENIF